MKNLLRIMVCALLLGAGTSWAVNFGDGDAAYQRGDYATAYTVMHTLATQGNVLAQANLGLMYLKGHGAAQSYVEAIQWYRLAAEQGDAGGQFGLGYGYETGQGVAQNYAEALKW